MRHSAGKQLRRTLRGFEQLEPRLMLAAQPIISEFMASNNGSIQDGFGKHSDWIELTNAGDTPVNLQGYYLSDSVSNLTKWSFPASTILNPGQYLIVFASGNNTVDPLGYYHTNYKLDADGEHVVLAAPDQTILSQFSTDGSSYPAASHGYFLRPQRHDLGQPRHRLDLPDPDQRQSRHHLDRHQFHSFVQRLHHRKSLGRLRHDHNSDQLRQLFQNDAPQCHDVRLCPHRIQS